MRPVFASATGATSTTTPSNLTWKVGPQPAPQAAQAYASMPEADANESLSNSGKIQARLASLEPPPVRPEPVRADRVRDETPAKADRSDAERREPTRAAVTAWVIQLGALDDEGKAREVLQRARSRSGRILSKASPFTEKVVHDGTTLYRARFSGFQEADSAQQACKTLKRSGFNCFATRS
jgi:D-alanyl-D-alanine carboxypeptidase